MLNTPRMPKQIMRVYWEHLANAPVHKIFSPHFQTFSSIPREAGDTESKWTVFHTSTAEVAALSCGYRLVIPKPDGGHWK